MRKVVRVKRRRERGDTLVEVAIAMAVLALILASTMTIINRSLLGVMNAVERTGARGEVDSQIEMLRYVFDTQSGVNKDVAKSIIDHTQVNSGDTARELSEAGCSITSNGGFYLSKSTNAATAASAPIVYNGYGRTDNVAANVDFSPHAGRGIWIEGVKTEESGGMPGYIDFYVRACWSPYASEEIGQGRLESAVRVYYREDD